MHKNTKIKPKLPVRTAHKRVHITVHNCCTQYRTQ